MALWISWRGSRADHGSNARAMGTSLLGTRTHAIASATPACSQYGAPHDSTIARQGTSRGEGKGSQAHWWLWHGHTEVALEAVRTHRREGGQSQDLCFSHLAKNIFSASPWHAPASVPSYMHEAAFGPSSEALKPNTCAVKADGATSHLAKKIFSASPWLSCSGLARRRRRQGLASALVALAWTHRHTDTQTHRHTDTHRQTHRQTCISMYTYVCVCV
jgi:hypothetical protein